MLQWLESNIATILIASGLAIILGLIIARMIKNKKNGKSSCSCGCENCAMKGECHK